MSGEDEAWGRWQGQGGFILSPGGGEGGQKLAQGHGLEEKVPI